VEAVGRDPTEVRGSDLASLDVGTQSLALRVRDPDRDKGSERLRLLAQEGLRDLQCVWAQAEGELGRNAK
jgi:hypothetical protein